MLPAFRAGRADRDRQAERAGRLARREVADEDPLVDEHGAHARHAVVIPPERPHTAREGRVGGHRHVGGSVSQLSAVLGPHERRPGERDLVLEKPIGLGGMSAGLVYQQREELRSEHERRRTFGRKPSRLSHQTRVKAARWLPACLHGENGKPRARLDDLLSYVGAFACDEVLARAVSGHR